MKIIEMSVEGPSNENTIVLQKALLPGEELHLDLAKLTFINSIGVKSWVSWIMRCSTNSYIKIFNAPYVIVSQANMVFDFLTRTTSLESFYCYYTCVECQNEESVFLKRGEHYNYKSESQEKFVKLPADLVCSKCKGEMEPDFFPDKIFKFLDL